MPKVNSEFVTLDRNQHYYFPRRNFFTIISSEGENTVYEFDTKFLNSKIKNSMAYLRAQMLYDKDHYYKWTATADHDNPNYIQGKDRQEMNKTEGYEVLRFINELAKIIWTGRAPRLDEYHQIEKMLRHDVPSTIRSHAGKREWIQNNWLKVTYP